MRAVTSKTVAILIALLAIGGVAAIVMGDLLPADDVKSDQFRPPDVAFTSTPFPIVEHMLDLAELEEGDVLFDLGSGDGRIVIAAGEKYGAHAVGVEIDPDLVLLSRDNVEARGLQDRVDIEHADIFSVDLSRADAITLYLSNEMNRRLMPQLQALKPGVRIVSHKYGLPDVAAEKAIRFRPDGPDGPEYTVFMWRTPLRPEDNSAVGTVERRRLPDVGFVATPQSVVDEMLRLGQVESGNVLFDLGSGDGRIVIAAAKQFGVRATGFEIDPRLIELSRELIQVSGVEDLVAIEEGDLFDVDLSSADVVTLYLSEAMNRKLIPQFERLKPGARIVSHNFDIPGIERQEVVRFSPPDGGPESKIFLWRAPLIRTQE